MVVFVAGWQNLASDQLTKLLTGKRVFGQTAMENIAVCRNLDHGAGNSARRNLNSKRLARHITPCMANWSRLL